MPQAEFFLIGDSHAVAIGAAAQASGRPFRGGPLGSGVHLQRPFYRRSNGHFVLEGDHFAPFVDEFKNIFEFEGPIISTLGFNAHRFALDWRAASEVGGPRDHEDVSPAVFRQSVLDSRQAIFSLVQDFVQAGQMVYVASSPRRGVPDDLQPLLRRFEETLLDEFVAIGAIPLAFHDRVFDPRGVLLPEYQAEGDAVHGNTRFGEVVLRSFNEAKALHDLALDRVDRASSLTDVIDKESGSET